VREAGDARIAAWLEPHVFGHRTLILCAFALVTLALGWVAVTGLKLDTNFNKQLPLEHEYIRTYLDHKEEFGGANRLLIAAGPQALVLVRKVAARSQHDHPHRLEVRMVFDNPRDLPSVHSRHHDVQQKHGRLHFLQLGQGFLAVHRRRDRVAARFQVGPDNLERVGIVVYDQD
jgi:hypothetical protein